MYSGSTRTAYRGVCPGVLNYSKKHGKGMGKRLRRKGGGVKKKRYDAVEHPRHYVGRVPGVECITVASRFDFCLGNVVKYVWRAGRKGGPDKELEDLRKAEFYLRYRIRELQKKEER